MEYCPPYTVEDPSSWYFSLLNIIFCVSVFINLYVFYCIVFLSNRQMKTYRWYLLWHQVLVFATDIIINFLGQPIVFYPFRMGYPTGILKDVIPSFYFVALVMLTIFFELCSDAHLFLYRLITIKGYDHFPWLYKIWAGLPYLLASIVVMMQIFTVPNQEQTIQKYSQMYTCINESLLEIPNFVIYDEEELRRSEKVQWACLASVLLTMPICMYLSLKATTTKTMSPRLVKLQRRFLGQLVVLIFVPLGIVVLPITGFSVIIMMKLYDFNAFGNVVIAICSMVSTIGGIALIIMNPSYRAIFCRRFEQTAQVSVGGTSAVVVIN